MARDLAIPLPRDWKPLVKRAILSAIGLERLALADVRSGLENSPDPRAQLTAERDRALEDADLLREELRIVRARMAAIPAARRPHYPPHERFAILALRAKRCWNAAQTARRFQLPLVALRDAA